MKNEKDGGFITKKNQAGSLAFYTRDKLQTGWYPNVCDREDNNISIGNKKT